MLGHHALPPAPTQPSLSPSLQLTPTRGTWKESHGETWLPSTDGASLMAPTHLLCRARNPPNSKSPPAFLPPFPAVGRGLQPRRSQAPAGGLRPHPCHIRGHSRCLGLSLQCLSNSLRKTCPACQELQVRPGLSEAMFLLAVLWPLRPARRISPAAHSLGLGRYYWALLEVHRKHSTRETPEMPHLPSACCPF